MHFFQFVLARRFISSKTDRLRLMPKISSFSGKATIFGTVAGTATMAYLLYDRYRVPPTTELSQDYFTPYRVSHKQDIDDNHFIIQLTPLNKQKINLWELMGSEKMWSVQIKQPQIMVVRNYTPLPLIFNKSTSDLEPMKDGEFAEGKLLLYVKQYERGEVARWLHGVPEDEIVELRGPYIEYEFPKLEKECTRSRDFLIAGGCTEIREENFKFQPFDIVMYTAGTGVVTALQLMLTESPFRGTIELFHSCKNVNELGPLKSLLLKLETHKRLKLHISESSVEPCRDKRLQKLLDEIPQPCQYKGLTTFQHLTYDNIKPVLALVCGPDTFISSIAGPKLSSYQGPIGGILARKDWTHDNVFKLS